MIAQKMTTNSRAFLAAATLSLFGGAASGQTYTPLAFGPVPGDFGTRFVNQIRDISADGQVVIGRLSDSSFFASGPLGATLLGFDTPRFVSLDGQTIIGGRFVSATNQPVVRWTLGSSVGTDLPLQSSAVNGINADATRFLFGSGIRDAAGNVIANGPTFPDGVTFWGALNALASRAPVSSGAGGLFESGYRYNYQTGTLQSLQAVPGTSATLSQFGLSGDGTISVGTASVQGQSPRPVWWDANGTPSVVPPLAGATAGLGNTVNDAGTLIGGNWSRPSLDTAFVYSIALNETIDVGQIFRDAGLLPAGWRLITTTHISDDGSRIFCTATAPDGTTRAVMLSGTLNVPTPGAAALLALGGMAAARRRR